MHQINDSHALVILERDLLLIDFESSKLVHVRLVHPAFKTPDKVTVEINGVFDHIDSALQLFLEMFCVVVAQFFLVIADRVEHRSELLKFLARSDVEVSQVLNVHLFVDVITMVVCKSGRKLIVVTSKVLILHISRLLSLLSVLAKSPDNENNELVDEVANEDADCSPKNNLCRSDVVSSGEESVRWLLSRSVVNFLSVILWSKESLVGEHEANHNKMNQYAIFDKADGVYRDHFIEIIGFSKVCKKQPLPHPIAYQEM